MFHAVNSLLVCLPELSINQAQQVMRCYVMIVSFPYSLVGPCTHTHLQCNFCIPRLIYWLLPCDFC